MRNTVPGVKDHVERKLNGRVLCEHLCLMKIDESQRNKQINDEQTYSKVIGLVLAFDVVYRQKRHTYNNLLNEFMTNDVYYRRRDGGHTL